MAGSLSHYRSFLASAHDLKVGVQVEQGANTAWTAFQGGVVSYTDNAGQPVQATFRQPATSGGEFLTTGLYAMDSVRFADRFTINLGVRFDHDRAISQDLPAHDALGNEGGLIAGLGTLYSWNVVSPRLGFTVKLTEDGKTILRANYGRFHQGILTGELNPVHPGMTPITTAAFDATTGRYSRVISVVDPTINVRLDPDMKSPQTNQMGIGVDRELARHTSVTISYVRKDGSDFIGWTDTGGVYRPDTRTLTDGRIVPVLALANGTAARRFLLTNPPDYFIRYNGVMTAFERRWSGGWQALASYTLSKTEGLESSSGSPAGLGPVQFDIRQYRHVRPRSEYAHQRHGSAPQRPDARVSRDGVSRDSQDRLRVCRQPPVPDRLALGSHVADLAAAGADTRPARDAGNATSVVADIA